MGWIISCSVLFIETFSNWPWALEGFKVPWNIFVSYLFLSYIWMQRSGYGVSGSSGGAGSSPSQTEVVNSPVSSYIEIYIWMNCVMNCVSNIIDRIRCVCACDCMSALYFFCNILLNKDAIPFQRNSKGSRKFDWIASNPIL